MENDYSAVGFLFTVNDRDITLEQARHIEEIGREFCYAMSEKYIKGQKEHGGNLWEASVTTLLGEALNEAIDQVVYILALRRKLQTILTLEQANQYGSERKP